MKTNESVGRDMIQVAGCPLSVFVVLRETEAWPRAHGCPWSVCALVDIRILSVVDMHILCIQDTGMRPTWKTGGNNVPLD
jgi:hypothetical protein